MLTAATRSLKTILDTQMTHSFLANQSKKLSKMLQPYEWFRPTVISQISNTYKKKINANPHKL